MNRSGGWRAINAAKFPQVPTDQHDLQDLPPGPSSTACCAWTPWSSSHQRTGHRSWSASARPCARGLAVPDGRAHARRSGAGGQPGGPPAGRPVVEGEVVWEEPDGYYHHYPSMQRVRTWLADAGFTLDEEAEGPGRGGIRLPPRAGPSGVSWLRMSSWHLDRPLMRRREQRSYRG